MAQVHLALFVDPFNGKCVHGNDGARIQAGELINPGCGECNPPPKKKPFCICAAYGGHVWRLVKIHDATSFGKVQDRRVCAFCPRVEVRDRFLGAAIRTGGEWREVDPKACKGAECYGCPVACPEKGFDISPGTVKA